MRRVLGNDGNQMQGPDNPNEPVLLFEQYKLMAEDLSRIREQRDRAIRTYITVNSIILAAFGLLLRGPQPNIGWELAVVIVAPLFLIGAIASLQWIWRLQEFEVLVNQRLVVLELIERNPKTEPRIHQAFTRSAFRLAQRETNGWTGWLKYTYRLPILPVVFLLSHIALGLLVLIALGSGDVTDGSPESTVPEVLLFRNADHEDPRL